MAGGGRRTATIGLILLAAFFLRSGAAVGVQWLLDHRLHRAFLIPGDADGYWELARKISVGDDFAIYDPPRYVLRMPGFPLLLAAGMKLWGENFLATRFLLAGVGTLACWYVYRLGAELYDHRTGCWAAALAAVSPVMVGFSVLILSETAFACALTASLFTATRLLKTEFSAAHNATALFYAAHCGAWAAVAVYMRPSWLPFLPLLALVPLAWTGTRRTALMRAAVLCAAIALALTPWTVRNYRVTGHLVPTTLWFGASLYDGWNPRATGDSDMTFIQTDGLMQRMSEYDVDQEYRRRAWEYARANPRRALELAGAKALRFWSPWPNADQFRALPLKVVTAGFFLPILLLAAIGLSVTPAATINPVLPAPRWFWPALLLWGPILFFAALHMLFVGSLRYRLPAEYPLLVLSAAGGLTLWKRWRNAADPPLAPPS